MEDVKKIHWRVQKIQGSYSGGCRGYVEVVRKLLESAEDTRRLQWRTTRICGEC